MRAALLFALLAVAASAQTDDAPPIDRDAILAEARSHAPSPDDPPTFVASWADPVYGRGSGGGNFSEGTYGARGIYLHQMLLTAWTSAFPFREDPIPLHVRSRLIDLPHALNRRQVDVRMVQPGLTRETFGAALLDRIEDALGFDVTFENRPTVVYALRVAEGETPRFPAVEIDPSTSVTMRAWDHQFMIREGSSFALARGLGGALGHVVVDEAGVDGPFDLVMDFAPDEVDFMETTMRAEAIDAVRAPLREAYGLALVPEVRAVEWMVVRERD